MKFTVTLVKIYETVFLFHVKTYKLINVICNTISKNILIELKAIRMQRMKDEFISPNLSVFVKRLDPLPFVEVRVQTSRRQK